jgi:hypothetical protein
VRRVCQVNEALGGGSFVEDEDDPFEGLTPEEIQARAALCRAGCRVHLMHADVRALRHAQAMVAKEAPAGDAFEGMSPEEINTYLQREQAERAGEPLPPLLQAAPS